MHNVKELKIWQKSIDVCVDVYKATVEFTREGLFGLSTQMNRSAVSIAANISEGAGRKSNKEFKHFLGIVKGSSSELKHIS